MAGTSSFEYRADLGRYWTTHARTELSVGTSNGWEDYDVAPFPVPGVPTPIYAATNIERRLTTVAPAFTWQFRENAFMHPYVSGGVKIGILEEHRVRTPDLYRFGPSGRPGAAARRADDPRAGAPLHRRRLQVVHLAVGVRAHRRTRAAWDPPARGRCRSSPASAFDF